MESYKRAEIAQKTGWFNDEIVPLVVQKNGVPDTEITITQDDIRLGTTYEKISKIVPAFPSYGDTTHAGNASQVTDGEYATH